PTPAASSSPWATAASASSAPASPTASGSPPTAPTTARCCRTPGTTDPTAAGVRASRRRRVLELPRPGEGEPFDHVQVAGGRHRQRQRGSELVGVLIDLGDPEEVLVTQPGDDPV